MKDHSWNKSWRTLALVVIGVWMGATLITPAVAHVTSSLAHLFTHTDQRYYKKTVANTTFFKYNGTLPAGKTLRGTFVVSTVAAAAFDPAEGIITFALPLKTAPNVVVIPSGDPTPATCLGTIGNPGAKPGNLCIFVGFSNNSINPGTLSGVYKPDTNAPQGATRWGAVPFVWANAAGLVETVGTWAVTAPTGTAQPTTSAPSGRQGGSS